ncbi:MAG: hypothetical protein D6733_06895 [Methanobacteriota archaeon]|nr:MAG: hypothetical protein D6733_06895 [Euryarchaeota archaeon]
MMKDVLDDLKDNLAGVVGYFVIDENRDVLVHDVPELMVEAVEKAAKRLHYVIDVLQSTKPFDRVIIDSENIKLIAIMAGKRILVVLAEKEVNLPLLKLLAKAVVPKIKEAPVEVRPMADHRPASGEFSVDKVLRLYDALYGIAAEKLTMFYGESAVAMFEECLEGIREKHPKVLGDVGFLKDGKPDMERLKAASGAVSGEELIGGLEELLLAMLEAVKANVGPSISDEAIDEIIKTRETLLQKEDIQMPPFM